VTPAARRAIWTVALGAGMLALGLVALVVPALPDPAGWVRSAAGSGGRAETVAIALAGPPERLTQARALVAQGVAARVLSTTVLPGCAQGGHRPGGCRTGVRSTVDEAAVMRGVLRGQRVGRVVVATSRFHVLRTAAIFRLVFAGSGIEVRVVGAAGLPITMAMIRQEAWKLLPSIGAAMVARLSPGVYARLRPGLAAG
jgi:hypothetical protein